MTASLRDRVCAYLREGARPDALPPDDVLAVAREEGVLLVLADRLALPELARERRHAAVLPALGAGALSPCPIHALLVACVHRVAHHGDTAHLLWLYDVHLIARQLTAASRDAFRELAAARRMRAVCGRTLSMAQEAFGEIDAEWIASLAPMDAADEPSAVFVGGGMRQADILKSDLA